MSKVRVLVGTRKGAFVLTSDGKRESWDLSGPHFGGWEIYHMKASPADPNRVYASQSSSWFGQVIQRSNDGGRSWEPMGNEFVYEGVPGTHQWYDGTPHPWEFARGRHVPAHDPPRPEGPRADHDRHLVGGYLSQRRRGQDLAAGEPRPALRAAPEPHRRGRTLRPPHRHAPVAPAGALHAEALGRDAQRRRRRLVARGERK